jgi:hypothetical protein
MKVRWVLVLVAVVGCSFGSPEVQTIDNSCTDDASCPAGVCDGNICIDDSGALVDVTIEVLRGDSDPDGVTPASWAFVTESVSGSTTRDLVLPATRQVVGSVRWDGLRVPAMLRFVRRMAGPVAPLAPVAVEVDTLREATGGDGPGGYDFSTVLVAGETYDVVVLPSSDMVMTPTQATAPAIRSLPPIYMELLVDDGDGSEPFRFDVVFPAGLADGCTENIDIGCTLEAEVLSVDGLEALAEAGLQVRAIDKKTARVVSSIGETDENGLFAIRISDSAADYLIRVTSSAGRDPFPAVSVDPDVAFANDPVKKRIYIPRLDSVQFAGRVRDMDDRPVPGATVRFLSTAIFGGNQLGLEGSFSGSATTDAEGRFGAELLSGLYSITVTPPEDVESTWGVLTVESLVAAEVTATEALIVPSQIGLRGWVTTFRDESATGVTILARARLNEDLGARSQEAVSNDVGAFAMSVDVGLYDMHVKTSSESGFAWLVEPELVMSPEVGDAVRVYRLDPPIPVRGVIRTRAGEIVPNALIRAYVLTSAEGAASRPIQVAEAVSGEDGSYRLLIAPRLGDE